MSIDERVRRSLAEHAESVTPPPVDPEGSVARGVRWKRRRLAGVAGAVAVLVAGVAVSTGMRDNEDAAPATELPKLVEGALWYDAEGIHLGNTVVIPADTSFYFAAGNGGAVYVTDDGASNSVWYVDHDNGPAKLGDRLGSGYAMGADPVGTAVAWLSSVGPPQDHECELVVTDVAAREDPVRIELPYRACWVNGVQFLSVSDRAVVMHVPGTAVLTWTPDAGMQSESIGREYIADREGEAEVRFRGRDYEDGIITVAGDVFLRSDELSPAALSPGGRLAVAELHGHLTVINLETGSAQEVSPEPDVSTAVLEWVGADAFMVIERQPSSGWERISACVASTADCVHVTDWAPGDEAGIPGYPAR